jgi:hypothetical protein
MMNLAISRDMIRGAVYMLIVVVFAIFSFFCWQTYQRAYNGQAAFEFIQQQITAQQQAQQKQQQVMIPSAVTPAPTPVPAAAPPVPPASSAKPPAKGK